MSNRVTHATTFGFSVASLACWLVMFLTAHDVWHDTGRPDIWNTPGVPYQDLRVFVVGFYGLLVVLVAQFAVTAVGLVRARRGATGGLEEAPSATVVR